MADNLRYFNAGRQVPAEAQRKIEGGKLKGMSDINPMWRYQTLTELFGPIGFGWYYEVIDKKLEPGVGGEVAVFVDINLYIKDGEDWSKPIQGSGGSKFISNFKNGPETSDEAFKMATTDALSVCCKLLGIGADVYWQAGAKFGTKYEQAGKTEKPAPKAEAKAKVPVDDDLPEPKLAKPKPAEPSADEVEKAKAVKAPDGRTLGEILANNPEELKTVASANKADKALTSACVTVYNAWAKAKTA